MSDYVGKWKARAYSDDIPDEVPKLLQGTNRAPSYKAIALAILKNDLTFKSIGFSQPESSLSRHLLSQSKKTKQRDLF